MRNPPSSDTDEETLTASTGRAPGRRRRGSRSCGASSRRSSGLPARGGTRPDHVRPSTAERALFRRAKGIVGADVDPGRHVDVQAGGGAREDVVTTEVGRVVECSLRRLTRAEPERSRMRSDRTEAPDVRQVERAEAAPGDAADRHALGVGPRAVERGGDRLLEDVRPPPTVVAIVVVAVVAAVCEEHDRRAVAEVVQAVEQLVEDERAVAVAAAVEQDEERPTLTAALRDDQRLLELLPDVAAVDGEALAFRLGAATEGSGGEDGREAPKSHGARS